LDGPLKGTRTKLIEQIVREEGEVPDAYQDQLGVLDDQTGRLIDSRRLDLARSRVCCGGQSRKRGLSRWWHTLVFIRFRGPQAQGDGFETVAQAREWGEERV
jgi:hypothetical protein